MVNRTTGNVFKTKCYRPFFKVSLRAEYINYKTITFSVLIRIPAMMVCFIFSSPCYEHGSVLAAQVATKIGTIQNIAQLLLY